MNKNRKPGFKTIAQPKNRVFTRNRVSSGLADGAINQDVRLRGIV
ncbi:MAG: hypothetical protein WBA41_03185 [Rivularia sp. (in: cyanobacteria)]